MAVLSREQFQELRNKGLSVDQIVKFQRGEQPVPVTSFKKEESKTFLGKARDFATSIIGGGKLAEGVGMGIASGGIRKELSSETDQTLALQKSIQDRIRFNKSQGKDTSSLEVALKNAQNLASSLSGSQSAFAEALPTDKQVIGSSIRLGATLGGGYLTQQAAKLVALGKATTFMGGALRGGAVGASVGAIEGGIQAGGFAAEEDKSTGEIATASAFGAGVGALTGGAIGAVGGGLTGRARGLKDPNRVLDFATPKASELSPTEYEDALKRGLITPKTANKPAQYTLPDSQKAVVQKYASLFDKDPVKTSQNISSQIAKLDDEVGVFLRQNNRIFSKGKLRNRLARSMSEITDITVPEERLTSAKNTLIENFVKNLKTNDMESLWIARKEYDRAIDSAFNGSPTLQKEVKKALRNAVQEFISKRTPNTTYQNFMDDMSNLLRVHDDSVALKAAKERGLTAIGKWFKENPEIAKVLGWGTAAAVLGGGASAILGGGKSDGSSGG